MAYTESLVNEHLRRIPVDDYEFGGVEDKKTQTEHIIYTILTHIYTAVQLVLESEDDFDTIYGERTIGNEEAWLLLQTLLQSLADNQKINLNHHSDKLSTISHYFYQQ
jgi:hypothetical protein